MKPILLECGADMMGEEMPSVIGGVNQGRPSNPDVQISRIKCGAPHLMRNVAPTVVWR
jgi:hypothetical protein